MSVYIKLFHGRDRPNEVLEDWGYDGPVLGPFDYVHTTYASDIKFSVNGKDDYVSITNDLFPWDGKFYGDWSVTSERPNDE